MKKKRSNSSNIIFEKLDQNDFSMERIFEEIENIPDKDQFDEISSSKYLTITPFIKLVFSSIMSDFTNALV